MQRVLLCVLLQLLSTSTGSPITPRAINQSLSPQPTNQSLSSCPGHTVYQQGEESADGSYYKGHCYREPTIIQTRKGTLLAFAEKRLTSCSDDAEADIVVKRSSDYGKSWGKMITVVKGGHNGGGNPVELEDGTILVHYGTKDTKKSVQIRSNDDGQTWGNSIDISKFMRHPGCGVGPSVGIRANDGTVYFSCHGGGGVFLYWSTSTDYSEWKSSKLIDGENECSIAFLKNQTVIMNCRTGHHSRDLLYWSRNGELISHVNHPELVDPDCQGSIISFNESLYISGNDDPNDRVNMRVKKSTDQGQSWEKVETVWSGYGGYSQLVGVGDHMHLLFEFGGKDLNNHANMVHAPLWAVDQICFSEDIST